MKTIIVAYDQDRAIGREGRKPWIDRMAADKAHFRRLTNGMSVIVGHNTLKLLSEDYWRRQTQTIALSMGMKATERYQVAHSIDEAYDMAQRDIMIIGGGQVFEQTLDDTDVVLATEIESADNHGDTFFPDLPEAVWQKTATASYPRDVRNEYPYSFVRYIRRSPNE